ncbi:MAG: MFS transporter, partial [Chloroflexota bacterium]
MAFTMQLGMGIMSPVLPEVKSSFGVSATEVALVVSAFGFARLLLDLPVGLLLDRTRPFVLLLVGTFVIAIGALIGSLSTVFPMIILARGLMGAGSAICMMTAQFTLSNIAVPSARGRVLGAFQASALAGSSFSPVIGGAIAVTAGWRASFGFTVLSALLAFASVIATQPRTRTTLASAPESPREATFEATQLTRQSIVTFAIMGVVTLVLYIHVGGFQNTVLPLIGGIQLGLDAATIGLALTVGTVVRVGASLVGGTLSDRYGRRLVIIPGLVIMGFGVLAFNYVDSLLSYTAAI